MSGILVHGLDICYRYEKEKDHGWQKLFYAASHPLFAAPNPVVLASTKEERDHQTQERVKKKAAQ